jgi:hypothetical protein
MPERGPSILISMMEVKNGLRKQSVKDSIWMPALLQIFCAFNVNQRGVSHFQSVQLTFTRLS